MSVDAALMAVLVCPQCRGTLAHRDTPEALVCGACRIAYPVEGDIPIMLIDEAEELDSSTTATSDDTEQ